MVENTKRAEQGASKAGPPALKFINPVPFLRINCFSLHKYLPVDRMLAVADLEDLDTGANGPEVYVSEMAVCLY